jgi:hypothetical protein
MGGKHITDREVRNSYIITFEKTEVITRKPEVYMGGYD